MACRSGSGCSRGRRTPTCPSFGGNGTPAFNLFGFGLPFSPEVAVGGLQELLSKAGPILETVVNKIDEKMVEEAIRLSVGETTGRNKAQRTSACQQFKETVKVDKSGEKEQYRVDIVLGGDAKPEGLKIGRKAREVTINVKIEKSTEDGSFRLYQEYTRKLTFPENVDLSQLESTLSPEGILTIQAPFLPKPEEIKPVPKEPIQVPIIVEDDSDRADFEIV